jgi:hypothetical protein
VRKQSNELYIRIVWRVLHRKTLESENASFSPAERRVEKMRPIAGVNQATSNKRTSPVVPSAMSSFAGPALSGIAVPPTVNDCTSSATMP